MNSVINNILLPEIDKQKLFLRLSCLNKLVSADQHKVQMEWEVGEITE